MVPWWKRVVYSILSVLIADCVGFLVLLGYAIAQHDGLSPLVHLEDLLLSFYFVLVYSAPGWLAALPAVLAIRSIEGWRFWFCAAFGSMIGPGLLYGMSLYFSLRTGYLGLPKANIWTVTAAVISVLATIAYLYWMKRESRGSRGLVPA